MSSFREEVGGYDFFDVEPDGFLVEGKFVIATASAVLWQLNSSEEVWIPKSQIMSESPDCLIITPWLASARHWNDGINDQVSQGHLDTWADLIPF